jgi:HEAT repeat protein
MGIKAKILLEKLKTLLGIFTLVLISCWIWTLNPIEDFMGRWFDFVNPNRYEQLYTRLSHKTDMQLLNLLSHGDFQKAEAAKVMLSSRGNEDLFDLVAEKLEARNKELRARARDILRFLDQDKAVSVYMQSLEHLPIDSNEYRQVLSILVVLMHEPVYEYLIEYAKADVRNQHASSEMLKHFGDPKAIPILRGILKTIPEDDNSFPARLERKRVLSAIEELKKIENEKPTNQ